MRRVGGQAAGPDTNHRAPSGPSVNLAHRTTRADNNHTYIERVHVVSERTRKAVLSGGIL